MINTQKLLTKFGIFLMAIVLAIGLILSFNSVKGVASLGVENQNVLAEAGSPNVTVIGARLNAKLRNITLSGMSDSDYFGAGGITDEDKKLLTTRNASTNSILKTVVFDYYKNSSGVKSQTQEYYVGGVNAIASLAGQRLNADGSVMAYGIGTENLYILSSSEIYWNADMSYMFYYCLSLESATFNNLNTSNVTNLGLLFAFDNKLESITGLQNWDTSNVTDFNNLFRTNIVTTLEVEDWDFSSAEDINSMFAHCYYLTGLDVSKWDVSNITNFGWLFYSCRSLTEIDVKDWTFRTSNFANGATGLYMRAFLWDCSGLTSVDLSWADTSSFEDVSYFFQNCSGLTEINISNWVPTSIKDMSYMFADCPALETVTLWATNPAKLTTLKSSFYNCTALKTINNMNYWTLGSIIDFSQAFMNCSALEAIDVSNFNTSTAENMSFMFYKCNSLGSLNVSNFDTRNVIDMSNMFYDCVLIEELDVSNFNTARCTKMNSMFHGMNAVSALDVSNFDTTNVVTMNHMFAGCLNIQTLDVSDFDTTNVINMEFMFYNMQKVNFLDVSNFNTLNVTNMAYMFASCHMITNLNVSNFNTKNVTNMQQMFYRCNEVTELDVTSFNTQKVTSMYAMFQGCGFSYINLSSFNMQSVTNAQQMFLSCCLYEIVLPYNLKTTIDFNYPSMPALYNPTTGNAVTSVNASNNIEGGRIVARYSITYYETNGVQQAQYYYFNSSNEQSFALPQKNDGSTWKIILNTEILSSVTSTHIIIPAGAKGNIEVMSECGFLSGSWKTITGIDTTSITSVIFTNNNTGLTGFASYNVGLTSFGGPSWVAGSQASPVTAYINNTNIYIYCEDTIVAPLSMASMFSGFSSLETINFNGVLNTTRTTTFSSLFFRCTYLENVDLTGINTENVTTMSYMFYECYGLQTLNLAGFDISKVTSFRQMFYNCSGLRELIMPTTSTTSLTDVYHMFSGCEILNELDLSYFDMATVSNVEGFLLNCNSLKLIGLPYNVSTYISIDGGVYYYSDTHEICTSINSVNCSTITNKRVIVTRGTIVYKINNVTSHEYYYYSQNEQQLPLVQPGEFMEHESVTISANYANITIDDNVIIIPARTVSSATITISSRYTVGFLNKSWNYLCSLEKSNIVSIVFTNSNVGLTGYSSYNVGLATLGGSSWTQSSLSYPVTAYVNENNVYIYCEKQIVAPVDCNSMFSNCTSLTNIVFGNVLNTSKVTNFSYLFNNCYLVESLDLSGFNTNSLLSMKQTFYNMYALKELNVSSFNTENVTDMYSTFQGCSSLQRLDLSNFNLASLENTSGTFSTCRQLSALSLPYNVATEIALPYTYVTKDTLQQYTAINSSNCATELQEIQIYRRFSISLRVNSTNNVRYYFVSSQNQSFEIPMPVGDFLCTSIEITTNSLGAESIISGNTLIVSANATGDIQVVVTGNYYNGFLASNWRNSLTTLGISATAVTKIEFTNTVPLVYTNSVDVSSTASGQADALDITMYLNGTDVYIYSTNRIYPSNSMRNMFSEMTALTTVKFNGVFNSSNVTDTYGLFNKCSSLTTVDLYNLDTSNVTNMGYMFYDCKAIVELDLSCLDTSKVTSMYAMLHGLSALTSLDININTKNVTDMAYLFTGQIKMQEIDISMLNTSKVTNMKGMFSGCIALLNLDVSHFNTSNVTNMQQMFNGCSKLTTLDVTNFDTTKVTTMNSMFYNCRALTSLDLSNFNMENVTDTTNMTTGVTALSELYMPYNLKENTVIALDSNLYFASGEKCNIINAQNCGNYVSLANINSTENAAATTFVNEKINNINYFVIITLVAVGAIGIGYINYLIIKRKKKNK